MTASIAPLLFALPLAGTTAGSLADPATSALLGRLALWMPLLLGMTSYGARRFDEVVLAPTRLRRWATAAAVGVAAFISLLTLSYTRTYGSNQALSTDIDYLVHDLLVSVLDFLHVTQGERLSTLTHGLIMPVCVWILPSSFLLRRSLERTATSRALSLRTGFLFGLAVGLFVFSIARPMIDLLLMSLGGPSNYDIGVGLGLLLREGDASVLTPSRTHILLTLIGTLAAVAVGTRPLRHRPSLSETYLHLRDLGKAAPKRIPRERVSHPHRVHRQPKSVTKKVPAPDPAQPSIRDPEIVARRDRVADEASALRTRFSAVAATIEGVSSTGTLLDAAQDIARAHTLIRQAGLVNRRIRAVNQALSVCSRTLAAPRLAETPRGEWRARISPALKRLQRRTREAQRLIVAGRQVLTRRASLKNAAAALDAMARGHLSRSRTRLRHLDGRLHAGDAILRERSQAHAIALALERIGQRRFSEVRPLLENATGHPRVSEVRESLKAAEDNEAAYARIETIASGTTDPEAILDLLEHEKLLDRERRCVGRRLGSVTGGPELLANYVLPTFLPMVRSRGRQKIAATFLEAKARRFVVVFEELAALLDRETGLPSRDTSWKTSHSVTTRIVHIFEDSTSVDSDVAAGVVAALKSGQVRRSLPNVKWSGGQIERELIDWLCGQIVLVQDAQTLETLASIGDVQELMTRVVLNTVLPMVTRPDREELARSLVRGEIPFALVVELDTKLPDRDARAVSDEASSGRIVSVLQSADYAAPNAGEIVSKKVVAATVSDDRV